MDERVDSLLNIISSFVCNVMRVVPGPIPSLIGQPTGLEYLSIRENSMSGDIPSLLGLVTALRYFSVAWNYLLTGKQARENSLFCCDAAPILIAYCFDICN